MDRRRAWATLYSTLVLAMFSGVGCSGAEASTDGGLADAAPDAGGIADAADVDSGLAGGDGGRDEDAGVPGFVRVEPNDPDGYLCDIPGDYVATGGDPTYVPCGVAAGRFSDRDPSDVPASLRVVTWNVEFGADSATVLSTLMSHPELMGADVLLLEEVARHNLASDPPRLDQAEELARALAMDFVFAVEWDRRLDAEEEGEHGVAILSRYPIGNVTQIRHEPVNDWYEETGHFGGRITLGADLLVGWRLLRVYASHLDTRPRLPDDSGRARQAAEIRADANLAGRTSAQIVGGDLNTWTCNPTIGDCASAPAAEQAIEEFLAAGWLDGTAGFNGRTQNGAGFFPQRLDWIFYRGLDATAGTAATDATGSDHLPLYFDVDPSSL